MSIRKRLSLKERGKIGLKIKRFSKAVNNYLKSGEKQGLKGNRDRKSKLNR